MNDMNNSIIWLWEKSNFTHFQKILHTLWLKFGIFKEVIDLLLSQRVIKCKFYARYVCNLFSHCLHWFGNLNVFMNWQDEVTHNLWKLCSYALCTIHRCVRQTAKRKKCGEEMAQNNKIFFLKKIPDIPQNNKKIELLQEKVCTNERLH